jgi:NADH-quinone oxidoreductase subunit B
VALTREPADALRARQLRARDLLRGDLEGAELERHVEERIMTTTLDRAVAWARGNALYPATFGLACCAIEMMSIVTSRVDAARFGYEAWRASPRQADLLIISGRISIKMAPVVRRIWDQMLEPKWSIAMGACSSSMGVFNNYAIVPADKFMPVDVHVPGCPPRPEALMHGILRLRAQILGHPDQGWRSRYRALGTEEVIDAPLATGLHGGAREPARSDSPGGAHAPAHTGFPGGAHAPARSGDSAALPGDATGA